MNEEKPIINNFPPQNPTPRPNSVPPDSTMQNVVQEFLPDDIKKQFVMQKNNGGAPINLDPKAPAAPPYAQAESKFAQKAIRTYESDLADALANKNTSAASIFIAENKRKDLQSRGGVVPPAPQMPPRVAPSIPPKSAFPYVEGVPTAPSMSSAPAINIPDATPQEAVAPRQERNFHLKQIFLTLVSLVLIGGGIFEGYVLYQKSAYSKPTPSPTAIVLPSLIPSDKQVSLVLNGERDNQLIAAMYAELNKNSLPAGKNLELKLLDKNGEATTRVTGSQFIKKLSTGMPDIVQRSLTDRWMFGIYSEDGGQASSYLALTTDFFQNAFAGMLLWEDSLPDDLALLLNYKERANRPDPGASSTTSSYFGITGTWSDRVIRNRDVREFRSKQGDLLLLYSFINKQTLLLTTTESAFIGLLDRIEKDTYVR
jgi:hypothetical protein